MFTNQQIKTENRTLKARLNFGLIRITKLTQC